MIFRNPDLARTYRAIAAGGRDERVGGAVWAVHRHARMFETMLFFASAMVDNGEDGQGFGADHAWQYVAFVTVHGPYQWVEPLVVFS